MHVINKKENGQKEIIIFRGQTDAISCETGVPVFDGILRLLSVRYFLSIISHRPLLISPNSGGLLITRT